jgi:Arc/MetJ-type ribon-helix-helix transcriptional regulator
MKMITLFMPEKYLEMLDVLVANNLYPNRSEALRMATWKFIGESVSLMKAVPASAEGNASMAEIDDLLARATPSDDDVDEGSPVTTRSRPVRAAHET